MPGKEHEIELHAWYLEFASNKRHKSKPNPTSSAHATDGAQMRTSGAANAAPQMRRAHLVMDHPHPLNLSPRGPSNSHQTSAAGAAICAKQTQQVPQFALGKRGQGAVTRITPVGLPAPKKASLQQGHHLSVLVQLRHLQGRLIILILCLLVSTTGDGRQ